MVWQRRERWYKKAIYSNKGSRSVGIFRQESKRCRVNTPRLAIENVWTGTHSFYLGGHLEIECWVAFSLPLTGRLSFLLALDFSPLCPWLRNSIKSDGCWWRHRVVIMDHRRDSRKDGNWEKRETPAALQWLKTGFNLFLLDGAVAPLSGEMYNCYH